MKRWTVSLLAAGLLFNGAVQAAAPYKALYVFGDSYSDIGRRYLDGNGPTVPAHLARLMGIPFTYSSDANAGTKSLDFAATAATTGDDAGSGDWCCLGMMVQVRDFTSRVKSGTVKFEPDSTLFLLEGGLNDSDLKTEQTVANLTSEVHQLKAAGARHFSLALLPTRIPDFADIGKRLNPAYVSLVAALQKEGLDIRLNQWGPTLDAIMEHPAQYGIANTTSQCAGRALFKEDPTPCAAPDTYFFFHSGHPSTAVNKIVAEKLFKELGTVSTNAISATDAGVPAVSGRSFFACLEHSIQDA